MSYNEFFQETFDKEPAECEHCGGEIDLDQRRQNASNTVHLGWTLHYCEPCWKAYTEGVTSRRYSPTFDARKDLNRC